MRGSTGGSSRGSRRCGCNSRTILFATGDCKDLAGENKGGGGAAWSLLSESVDESLGGTFAAGLGSGGLFEGGTFSMSSNSFNSVESFSKVHAPQSRAEKEEKALRIHHRFGSTTN